jgi:hypothetical protein
MTDLNPPRGFPAVIHIHGRPVKGHWVGICAAAATRSANLETMSIIGQTLEPHQHHKMADLFEAISFGESFYPCENRGQTQAFSITQQIGGPAIGPIQIEPATAISVLREAIGGLGRGLKVYERLDEAVLGRMGADLEGILGQIERHPVEMLDRCDISLLVLRLKFGNLSFPIEGWGLSEPLTLHQVARAWKRTWNTAKGKGRVKDFIAKVEQMRRIIYGDLPCAA